MIGRFLFTLVFFTSTKIMAMDVNIVGSAVAGFRQAEFQAAPISKTQNMSEFCASASVVPRGLGWPVNFGFGIFSSLQNMSGGFGTALQDFGGFQIGPEIKLSKSLGSWTPFGRVRLAFGHFSGNGIEDWGSEPQAARLLYQTTVVVTKNFVTQGTHLALGTDYVISPAISIAAELDFGIDEMRSDARIIDNEREFQNKDVVPYHSRALLIGGQYSL